jgi:hypothetical protein
VWPHCQEAKKASSSDANIIERNVIKTTLTRGQTGLLRIFHLFKMSQIFKLTLWRVLDGFICIFILAPLVVFYWRGSFQLLDIYTYPSSLEISSYINLSIGILGTLLVNLSQTFVHTRVHGLPANVLQIICKRLYTYLFGWIIVRFIA